MNIKHILVVGTSNSIVRGGWYDGFQDSLTQASPDTFVERVALGGAPFSQFMSLQPLFLKKYDLIIVETCPNDEAHGEAVGSHLFMTKLMDDFFCHLTSHSNVVVVRIPTSDFLGKDNATSLVKKKICMRYGVKHIDFSAFISGLEPSTAGSFYRDRYHPRTEIAYKFGKFIFDYIVTFTFPAVNPGVCIGSYNEVMIDAENESFFVKTSLLEREFSIYRETEKRVKLNSPEYVIGAYIAKEHTNCIIRLHGPGETHRDIRWFYKYQENVGQILFVPIRDGYLVTAFSIVRPWRAVEYGLQSRMVGTPYELAISSFVAGA